MDENKVMFADGSIYDCPYLATAPIFGKLYITLAGVDMATAAAIFSDPYKTRSIRWNKYQFDGYIQCDFINSTEEGFKAQMSWPTVQIMENV